MRNKLFYIRNGVISANIEEEDSFQNAVAFCEQWRNERAVFIINTSGSTGIPKPIEITRTQMEASASMTAQALSLQAGDNALVCLNTEYIAGKMMLVRGMVNQLNLYITEPSSNPLLKLPDELQIDFMAAVPLQMETMIDNGGTDRLNGMKAIIVGGAPISLTLSKKIGQLTCPVYATYGMTETVSHIALKRLNGADTSDYFSVVGDMKIGVDERGCLTINSILTNHQAIITNDIIKVIDKQTFEWLGRADNVINSGGLKIHPEQLEDQVREILAEQGIDSNLIIAGVPDTTLGEKVVLILETEDLSEEYLKSLIDILKEGLPAHQAPKKIYTLKGFEYTETGKVKRSDTVNLVYEI
jgi:O-succinylbenzoic acid--CoA ligase